MFAEGPSNTALITAAARQLENDRPDKLFSDPYSGILAGEDGMRLLEEFGEQFTLVETIRTKYFDDSIAESLKKGKRQFVVLGAGLDTRPYRLEFPNETLWFEVDFAPILEYKRSKLKDAKTSCNVIDVPSDASKLDMQKDLVSRGFDPGKATVWVAEGLLPYLTDSQVEHMLSLISKASAQGSELIMTCPNRAIIKKSDYTRQRYEFMEKLHAQWVFSGSDNPDELFGKYGFKIEKTFVGHRNAHYNVLPWPPVESLPDNMPKEWFVKGVKT